MTYEEVFIVGLEIISIRLHTNQKIIGPSQTNAGLVKLVKSSIRQRANWMTLALGQNLSWFLNLGCLTSN